MHVQREHKHQGRTYRFWTWNRVKRVVDGVLHIELAASYAEVTGVGMVELEDEGLVKQSVRTLMQRREAPGCEIVRAVADRGPEEAPARVKQEAADADASAELDDQWEDLDRRVNMVWFGGPPGTGFGGPPGINGGPVHGSVEQLREDYQLTNELMLRSWGARDTSNLLSLVQSAASQEASPEHRGIEHWHTGIKARLKLAEELEEDHKFDEAPRSPRRGRSGLSSSTSTS